MLEKNCCEVPLKRFKVPLNTRTNKPQRELLKGNAEYLVCTLTTDFITQGELCMIVYSTSSRDLPST